MFSVVLEGLADREFPDQYNLDAADKEGLFGIWDSSNALNPLPGGENLILNQRG